MNNTDAIVVENLHRDQASQLRSLDQISADLCRKVREELIWRLQIHDVDATTDFIDWLPRVAIADILNPGELTHREMIDRLQVRWVDQLLAHKGWGYVDTMYRLEITEPK
jgi:hypothetical protein